MEIEGFWANWAPRRQIGPLANSFEAKSICFVVDILVSHCLTRQFSGGVAHQRMATFSRQWLNYWGMGGLGGGAGVPGVGLLGGLPGVACIMLCSLVDRLRSTPWLNWKSIVMSPLCGV